MKLWKKDDIPFYNEDYLEGFEPSVKPFIVEGSKACVVICPGGGYIMKALVHEGDHIAMYLNEHGISAFVLDYRIRPYKHPVPVIDAKRAIRYARYLATEYGYDKDKIGIMGFSAGGHLAGCAGVLKSDFGYKASDDIDKESSRPDFMALCYPVITSGYARHVGSFKAISDMTEDELNELSVEKNVDESCPPTYLMQSSDDSGVPVENSIYMALALSKHKIPFELHNFTFGEHGYGLADGRDIGHAVPYTDIWPQTFINWLKAMKFTD